MAYSVKREKEMKCIKNSKLYVNTLFSQQQIERIEGFNLIKKGSYDWLGW